MDEVVGGGTPPGYGTFPNMLIVGEGGRPKYHSQSHRGGGGSAKVSQLLTQGHRGMGG